MIQGGVVGRLEEPPHLVFVFLVRTAAFEDAVEDDFAAAIDELAFAHMDEPLIEKLRALLQLGDFAIQFVPGRLKSLDLFPGRHQLSLRRLELEPRRLQAVFGGLAAFLCLEPRRVGLFDLAVQGRDCFVFIFQGRLEGCVLFPGGLALRIERAQLVLEPFHAEQGRAGAVGRGGEDQDGKQGNEHSRKDRQQDRCLVGPKAEDGQFLFADLAAQLISDIGDGTTH